MRVRLTPGSPNFMGKKEDQARWYASHRVAQKARVKRNRTLREMGRIRRLSDYLIEQGCKDCGERDPVVLEFDHLRDKTDSVSKLFQSGWSWERLMTEIAKCEVVCRNCHTRRTAKRNGWRKAAGR